MVVVIVVGASLVGNWGGVPLLMQHFGAEEACWAHNPKVVGSRPTSAKITFFQRHTTHTTHVHISHIAHIYCTRTANHTTYTPTDTQSPPRGDTARSNSWL